MLHIATWNTSFDQWKKTKHRGRSPIDQTELHCATAGHRHISSLVRALKHKYHTHHTYTDIPLRSLLPRPNTILPSIRRREVATRVPHTRHAQLLHHINDILPPAMLVCKGTAGIVETAVDATAHVSVVSSVRGQYEELESVGLGSEMVLDEGHGQKKSKCRRTYSVKPA